MKSLVILFVFFAFHATFSQTVTLRDTTNQYDCIIITAPEFVTACVSFKQHKETVRGFESLIVDTTQIFAEFDSSSTPQENIRNFISYAGTFWKEPKPKFFLLAGTVKAIPNFLIPLPGTPSHFQSDYFYSQSIYENDSTTTDFYIGRIPATNSEQLDNYISKVVEYESNNTLQSWMNNALFICEDDYGIDFLGGAFSIAETLPSYIRPHFIFENDTSQYYGNLDSIYYAINNRGCSTIWFEGYSSDSSFALTDMFNIEDIHGLANESKYFISIFSSFQSAIIDSNTNLTREMLILQNAGSLGGIVFVGLSYWGIGKTFQNTWAQRLFEPSIQSIGESINLDNLPSGGIYSFMKKVTNLWADPSLKLKYDITVDVDDIHVQVPTDFVLFQNYPNPFNPTTKIKYNIPSNVKSEMSNVLLKVYDLLGNEIGTIVNEEKLAGTYEVEFNASNLSSGIYFYQLKADGFIETKKMILLR